MNNQKQYSTNNNQINSAMSPLMELFPVLFKFGLGVGVAAAKLAINEAGSFLGLDIEKPGLFGFNRSVPITEQSVEDIVSNLTNLGKKLQDPKVRAQIQILITQLEPIVKKAADKLVNIATETLALGLKDAVALACEVPPISVFCGMSKVAESGAEALASVTKSGDELLKEQKKADALVDNFKRKINSLENPQMNIKKSNILQTGGAKQIKKHRASTKAAIKRINSSLRSFYNSNKTKRHRSK